MISKEAVPHSLTPLRAFIAYKLFKHTDGKASVGASSCQRLASSTDRRVASPSTAGCLGAFKTLSRCHYIKASWLFFNACSQYILHFKKSKLGLSLLSFGKLSLALCCATPRTRLYVDLLRGSLSNKTCLTNGAAPALPLGLAELVSRSLLLALRALLGSQQTFLKACVHWTARGANGV